MDAFWKECTVKCLAVQDGHDISDWTPKLNLVKRDGNEAQIDANKIDDPKAEEGWVVS